MRGPRDDLAGRIMAFVRLRGAPASSHMLAGQFLKTTVGSEELATRLLRPLLDPAGASYVEASGWVVPEVARTGAVPPKIVAAAVERLTGRVALAPAGVLLEGATVVVLDPRADVPRVLAWLSREGLPRPASIVSLRGALRGAARIPRGADLEGICALLGVRWLDTEDAAGAAGAMAACIVEAALRREGHAAQEPAADEAVLPAGMTREEIAALPEAAGIYRFYDAEGDLLYVGKAANLRRRVSSYFTPSAARRPRRFTSRIHRLEHEVVASELEALLREARLIRRRAPEGNVQIEIHERGAVYNTARSFAILLPLPDARGATALFVRDGRHLGHVRIGPRGGGLATARGLTARAIRPRSGKDDARRPLDRDSRILNSWLARHGESVSRVELDSFRKGADAARALKEAVRVLLEEPEAARFR